MDGKREAESESHELKGNAIGLGRIVFFVIAAAAPLTGTLGAIPIAIGLGNGAGAPIAFVAAGLLLTLFSVGYGRMAVRVRNAGAFYAYVARGLGQPAGIGAAAVAILSYLALQIALYGLFGFFCGLTFDPLIGRSPGWIVYALAALVVVHLLGRRGVEVNGALLGILMIVESAIVLVLAGTIVLSGGGPDGLTLAPFEPSRLLAPGAGIALIFALACFVGFEATAIYAEEARDPQRTVPRATYLAVAAIALFFAFVAWAIVCAHGLSAAQGAAQADPGAFWFAISDRLLGAGYSNAMSVLLLGSTFASILAFHNMIARYLYALGREGVLWRALGRTDPVHRSPRIAGAVQSVGALVAILPCAVSGADPYAVVFGWGGALGTIGIIALQLLICIAIIAFFRREPEGESPWAVLIAPALSAIGLGLILSLALRNLSVLSGTDSPWLWALPCFQLLLFGGGMLLGRRRPAYGDPNGFPIADRNTIGAA